MRVFLCLRSPSLSPLEPVKEIFYQHIGDVGACSHIKSAAGGDGVFGRGLLTERGGGLAKKACYLNSCGCSGKGRMENGGSGGSAKCRPLLPKFGVICERTLVVLREIVKHLLTSHCFLSLPAIMKSNWSCLGTTADLNQGRRLTMLIRSNKTLIITS